MRQHIHAPFRVILVCVALGLGLAGCSDNDDGNNTPNELAQFRCEDLNNSRSSYPTQVNPLSSINIINGEPASSSQWPSIAALTLRGAGAFEGFHCSGTLIHPNWVLTAAHCAIFSEVDAVLGTESLTAPSANSERIAVVEKILHPNYFPLFSLGNDIALYRLEHPSAQPLASIDWNNRGQAGVTARAAGWGATDPEGTAASPDLLQLSLPVVSNETCRQSLAELAGTDPPLRSSMLCAGYAEGGKDICSGDSGGPLQVDGYLTGIVSWGLEICAQPGGYSVYTRVSDFTEWISSVICERESGE